MYIQATKTNHFIGKINDTRHKTRRHVVQGGVLKGSYDKVIDSAHLRNQRTN